MWAVKIRTHAWVWMLKCVRAYARYVFVLFCSVIPFRSVRFTHVIGVSSWLTDLPMYFNSIWLNNVLGHSKIIHISKSNKHSHMSHIHTNQHVLKKYRAKINQAINSTSSFWFISFNFLFSVAIKFLIIGRRRRNRNILIQWNEKAKRNENETNQ